MMLHRHSILAALLMFLAGCLGCSVLRAGGTDGPERTGEQASQSPETAVEKPNTEANEGNQQLAGADETTARRSADGGPEAEGEQEGRVPTSVPLSGGRRSLTGALSNATQQLKKRSRQVDDLRQQVTELEKKLGKRKQKISGLKQKLKDCKSRIEKLQDAVEKWKEDVIGFRNEMRSAEEAEMQALKQVITLLRRSRGGADTADSAGSQGGKEGTHDRSE